MSSSTAFTDFLEKIINWTSTIFSHLFTGGLGFSKRYKEVTELFEGSTNGDDNAVGPDFKEKSEEEDTDETEV